MMQTTEFKIEDLFVSANGDANLKKSDLTNTGLPLITSGLLNNGIAGLTDKTARVFDGHTITVDMFGNAFYRDFPYKMVTHARVFALLPYGWQMTEKTGLYITAQLCHFKEFFSYSNMCSFKKIKQMTISLPVISSDDPSHTYTSADIDWKYMQDYIEELEQDYIEELDAYLKASNLDDTELTDEEKETLKGPEKTKEFLMTDLGFKIFHGVRLTKLKRTKGNIPLLTAGETNQGVAQFIGNKDMPQYENAITVDMFGNCFYHDGKYTGDDNIYFFVNTEITEKAKLFIVSSVNKRTNKMYSYSRQFRQAMADSLNVSLPVTSTGTPDWHFTETYITAIEKLTIKDVVKYKNQMIKTTKQVVNC